MSEWLNALGFGVLVVAFVLGVSSLIMTAMIDKNSEKFMQQRVEYGFFGVSGLVIFLLLSYALA